MKNFIITIGIFLICFGTRAGELLKRKVSINYKNVTIEQIILDLAKNYDLQFFYSNKLTELQNKVSVKMENVTLKECLEKLLEKSIIIIVEVNGQIVLKYKQNFTVNGYIEDAKTGEKLIGANLYDLISRQGTTTNVYGFFSLTLPKGDVNIQFSFIGFQSKVINLNLIKDTIINISLESSLELKEVQVVAHEAKKIQEKVQMSSIDLSMDKVQTLPALMGEKDVMKTFQLMPGVQSGGEGASSLYVRGGGPDQNLILLDGIPIYNASHLFGFFSVFNSDAINSTKLIKGGFPSRYGGRLSSVIDIRLKEGNNKEKISGSGSMGLISSKLTLEGPIKSEKTSFLISGRRTYSELYTYPISKLGSNLNSGDFVGGYYFYDLNAKVNHKFTEKDRLYLSCFSGKDKFYFRESANQSTEKLSLQWGNLAGSIRWNHIFGPKLFSNLTLNYSKYKFMVISSSQVHSSGKEELMVSKYFSGVQDWIGKWEFDYYPSSNHQIKFGIGETYHHFFPGVHLTKDNTNSKSLDTVIGEQHQYSHEFYAFIEDEIKLGSRLITNLGIHGSGFIVQDKYYYSLQPRLTSRFLITQRNSIKMAYSYMSQYLHLLSNPTIGLPTDLWVPVTKKIAPQNSHQFALGMASSISEYLELSIVGYYKTMDNLIGYKDGASFYSSTNWENKVEVGKGWSYGMEFLLEKKIGKTSGWIGYTLSWTNRQFKNINFGKKFPYRYDRRNDIGIAITHKFNDRIDVGLVWVYGTGKAVTLGSEKYLTLMGIPNFPGDTDHNDAIYIKSRNNYREPSYHRMDIGINFKKEKKWGERTLNFSLYNTYSRLNPFYLYLDKNPETKKTHLMKVSLFPILPSISYSFKF